MKKQDKKASKSSAIDCVRHSLAHILAAAVQEEYRGVGLGIGPVIENGFYYDFKFKKGFAAESLEKIEKRMREIIQKNLAFSRKKVSTAEAKKLFKDQPLKLELIKDLNKEGKQIEIYETADVFMDLCRGGHVKNTKEIDPSAFKLTHIAGAYWKGDEKNTQLTRIYGVAFATKKELDAHLHMLEEAKKRDHKKLGPELDLFTFSELVGSGLPLWTPKGTVMRNLLDDFVWELRRQKGYEKVEIPHITKKDLYERSGHWSKFKEELFRINTREGHEFAMKPMNCPHHTQIYARKPWSYRELPQRYANTTMVYRDEQSGELAGLSRVLSITQDDAHVFCRMSQAEKEIQNIWDIVETFYSAVNFPLRLRVSLRDPKHPEKYLGTVARWKEAEKILRNIAKSRKMKFYEAPGEAAFYAPKLDFIANDSLGREWQVATIQLDVHMPESFDLTCTDEKGKPERIVMIHAAIMGSIERYMSVLIEHFAGAFPVWLAPVQVAVLPVGEKFADCGNKVAKALRAEDVRVEMKPANETLGKRIREAELMKIPYLLVVGEREEKDGTVSVRHFTRGQEGVVELKKLIEKLKTEIREKK